jgi:hypothetical protein
MNHPLCSANSFMMTRDPSQAPNSCGTHRDVRSFSPVGKPSNSILLPMGTILSYLDVALRTKPRMSPAFRPPISFITSVSILLTQRKKTHTELTTLGTLPALLKHEYVVRRTALPRTGIIRAGCVDASLADALHGHSCIHALPCGVAPPRTLERGVAPLDSSYMYH